jgi:hypothetical protein
MEFIVLVIATRVEYKLERLTIVISVVFGPSGDLRNRQEICLVEV